MTPTDIAAWYAAAIATAVLAWDILKWLRSGASLRINAVSNVSYSDGRVVSEVEADGGKTIALAEYCHVEVINRGMQPTTLITIEATHAPGTTGVIVGASDLAFVPHVGSAQLPAVLQPGAMWSARLEMNHLTSILRHGAPIIRVRASHKTRPIDKAISIERNECKIRTPPQ